MIISQLIDEDFTNYKLPAMLVAFPYCTFKCGKDICHNYPLRNSPTIELHHQEIIGRYIANPISQALVCAGLEPLDSFRDLLYFLQDFRQNSPDPIIIYTGYEEAEIEYEMEKLAAIGNVVIKFGRYLPGQKKHFDAILGVDLASDNQYAKYFS